MELVVPKGRFVKSNVQEVLSLTPSDMLESTGGYVLDDFYSPEEFRKDFKTVQVDLENLLASLDEFSSSDPFPDVGTIKFYSSNIYWFVSLFAHLYYLSRCSYRILKKFDKVVFKGYKYTGFNLASICMNHSSANFSSIQFGIQNLINSFITVPQYFRKKLVYKESSFLSHFFSYEIKNRMRPKISRKPGVGDIWVVQGGYEVARLADYFPEYSPFFPTDFMERMEFSHCQLPWTTKSTDAVANFLEKHFGGCNGLQNIFRSYHLQVACRLVSFCERFIQLIDDFPPMAAFYSVGPNRAHETMLARLFTEKDVPVFCFQHGGASNLVDNPLSKYFEDNTWVDTIRVRMDDFGSLKLLELSQRKSARKDRILYCPSSPVYHCHKDLLLGDSDAERCKRHISIVRATKELGIQMDIKPHPTEFRSEKKYFKKLVRSLQAKNVTILPHKPTASDILHEYKVIVVDFACSALIPEVFTQDAVILYVGDLSLVKKEFCKTFQERVYNVPTNDGLKSWFENCFDLDTRYSEEMERLLFPLGKENLGERISQWVKEKFYF